MKKLLTAAVIFAYPWWVPLPAWADETVNLSDIPDEYPVCQLEDCSDVPNQEGMWEDPQTGNWYFEQGDRTWLIVDDTAQPGQVV